MKVPFNWLKEFLDLSHTPEEVAQALTLAGIEVEGIEQVENDVVFSMSLTPNLGHCMSIIGIVRELAAILGISIRRQVVEFVESSEKIEDAIRVNIEDPLPCPKYCARLVRNVEVGPSPLWIRQKLEKSGLRPINYAVDVGNLAMLEMGQPVHMFDYDQLQGKEINVRLARDAGKMVTLDGVERDIPSGVLLVCDSVRPVAFAGVMGEQSSAVTEKTRNILIEAAHFTPQIVRKTSKALRLRSESSHRFERGIDPLIQEATLDFAAALLRGEIVSGIVAAIACPYQPRVVTMDPRRANRLLGIALSVSEMSDVLRRLEIAPLSETETAVRVEIPSYRSDLRTEVDLIEEVGRMHGFNHIPRKIPRHASSTLPHAPLFCLEEAVRFQLVAQGLQECLTCDLISPKQAAITAEKAPIHVMHPASVDQSILRPSLLPSLLEVVKHNLDRHPLPVAAFEVGHIHLRVKGEFHVESAAAIILTGNRMLHHFATKNHEVDFFELKGHVESLLDAFCLHGVRFVPTHLPLFHPGRQARVTFDGHPIGALGEVHPRHLRTLDFAQRVYFAEIHLHPFLAMQSHTWRVKLPPPFPSSHRDWTISLDETIPVGPLLEQMQRFDSPLLEEIVLLDLYQGEKALKGKKNATFRFRYRDRNKTIAAEEVEGEHKRLMGHIAEKLAIGVS